MQSLLISVIIPCYNQGCFLSETLDSVQVQTYKNWEAIIVDDGSTDETRQVAEFYCAKDGRIKYIYQSNAGLSAARNTGVKNSHGKYILPLDSDDCIGAEYMELAVKAFTEKPNLSVVYCKAALFGKRKGEWKLPEYSFERMLARNCIFCSAFYKKEDFDKVGGYKVNMKYGYEDWDFWLSILDRDDEVYKIDSVQFYYRIRSKSMVRSLDKEKIRFLRKQLWQNHQRLYAQYSIDITETFEYCLVADSYEYKLGSFLLKPLRFLYEKLF